MKDIFLILTIIFFFETIVLTCIMGLVYLRSPQGIVLVLRVIINILSIRLPEHTFKRSFVLLGKVRLATLLLFLISSFARYDYDPLFYREKHIRGHKIIHYYWDLFKKELM